MDAQVRDNSLTLVRKIKAPPEKVFAAWTDPKALSVWFKPTDDFTVLSAECDPRIGGRYRIVLRDPGGAEHRVAGVYREIIADRKLAFTWAWETKLEDETHVTVELRAIKGGTELTLTHIKFADDKSRDMHEHGWTGCLDHLVSVLEAA
jgi:uncharacterized protein YndB with AHSA1/START domain